MAEMIAVTGHHVGLCCTFCEAELHPGSPPVCLNAACFLFGWPCPLPVQRMIRDRERVAVTMTGRRGTSSMGPN